MGKIRSGVALKFGLLPVNVDVVSAIERPKAVSFKTLCTNNHDPHPISSIYTCQDCGNTDKSSFVKGQQVDKNTYAVVDADQLKVAAEIDPALQTEMPLTVHPTEQVDQHTIEGGNVYFLAPSKGADTAYALMLELLRQHPERAFVTVWAPRTVPSMYRLGVFNNALVLTELAWPEHVAVAPNVTTAPSEQEVALGEQLLTMATADFDAATYRDTRTERLAAIAAGGTVTAGSTPTTTGSASSLLDALTAAVNAA